MDEGMAPRIVIKSTGTGDPTTVLDAVISEIPWQDAFKLGDGMDAITGGVMNSALKPFTPIKSQNKTSSEHYRFIQSDSELNREIEVSASGKYNIQGVDVSASASYLGKIKYSELSTTLIAQYEAEYADYDEAASYELTSDAQDLIKNPSDFRNVYGDYFIAGARRSSRFIAVYTCQASTAESMDEFKASFSGEAPDVFSAEGSTRFTQAASSHNITTSVDIFLEGYAGIAPDGPWTPEKILEVLGWFKEHEQGIYLQTKLRHYSELDHTYPRAIPIMPSTFVELRQLYTLLWDVRSRYGSSPDYYQDQLKQEYTALDAGITANQNTLATDADLRLSYTRQTTLLLSTLNDIFSRMDFYYEVRNAIGTEPDNSTHEEGQGQNIWFYGYSTYAKSSAVVISSTDLRYHDKWTLGHRSDTLEYLSNGQTLIVGWEVISNWTDGTNGSWKKVIDQILLTDHAAVYVESQYDRGCDWTLRVYYVDARDYQFQQMQKSLDDMDKGYVPRDLPFAYPVVPGVKKLLVALYPYVPRLDQFKKVLSEYWNKKYPDVSLKFTPHPDKGGYNCYKDQTLPKDVAVVGLDNVHLASLVKTNQLKRLDESLIKQKNFYSFALDACHVDKKLYSVPHLGCMNVLLYRRKDEQLKNARVLKDIYNVIGQRDDMWEEWPQPGEGLLLSFGKLTTDALYYLKTKNTIDKHYPLYPDLPTLVQQLDGQTLSNLNKLTQMAGYAQVQYVDKNSERIDVFTNGIGRAFVAFTEHASFIPPAKIEEFSFRSCPLSDDPEERPQLYIDSFAINNQISGQEEEWAKDFIKTATDPEVVYHCLRREEPNGNPQFLIPTMSEVTNALAEESTLYKQIRDLVNEQKATVVLLNATSFQWLLGTSVPKAIQDKIVGPKEPGHVFDWSQVSDDPSAPTNLLDRW